MKDCPSQKSFLELSDFFDQHFFWSILASLPCTLRIHLKHVHMHACTLIVAHFVSLSFFNQVKTHMKTQIDDN